MRKPETAMLLKNITLLYPNFNVNEQVIDAWAEALKHTNVQDAEKNLQKYYEVGKFPPHPHDIAEVKGVNHAQLEYEALQQEIEANKHEAPDPAIQREIHDCIQRIRGAMVDD